METPSNNLDTFRILWIIKGILTLCFSLFPLLYVFLGAFISGQGDEFDHGPTIAGSIMLIAGIIFFIIFIAAGILTILTGSYIGQRRNYTFIFVISILNCFTGILGILLGIFTLIELNKPEVKVLFGKQV